MWGVNIFSDIPIQYSHFIQQKNTIPQQISKNFKTLVSFFIKPFFFLRNWSSSLFTKNTFLFLIYWMKWKKCETFQEKLFINKNNWDFFFKLLISTFSLSWSLDAQLHLKSRCWNILLSDPFLEGMPKGANSYASISCRISLFFQKSKVEFFLRGNNWQPSTCLLEGKYS